MMGRVGAKICVASITALALGGCTILPEPRPDYHGTGETLHQGSAFGVSVGMSKGDAERALEARDDFKLKEKVCLQQGSEESPDFKNYQPDAQDCGSRDTQEIWRVDSTMAWVTLTVNFHQGAVVRIKWFHGEGYIG
jgi:hypothetical protein